MSNLGGLHDKTFATFTPFIPGLRAMIAAISTITDKVWAQVEAWQSRPLEECPGRVRLVAQLVGEGRTCMQLRGCQIKVLSWIVT